MDTLERHRYKRSTSGVTIVAHVFGVLSLILMLVWLLHYRGGIELDSDNAYRVFNVHPFLMFFGFIFMAGEAMMAYKIVRAEHQSQKFVHMFFHLVAIVLGIVGIHATFKYHDMQGFKDMTSFHSWIGMGTFCLFILQWLFGFGMFMLRASMEARARALVWHVSGGRALLYMSICVAETGLMQKVTFLQLPYNNENRLVNFLALSILLFGVAVDLSVAISHHA
ncbi:reductase [Lithospermum erythrorhizon]|uniref:ascorbate ferrireductase (transmembrane) n=1 Tax=Lithospermum erythrorhizon TaxID=34254 RepID=A0AAV3PYV6_LITER